MLGRPAMVVSFDPAHYQLVYRNEGSWPVRRGIETFDYYRKHVRPDIFKDLGGLVSDQGETWYKLRSKVNPVMMHPRAVKSYVEPVDVVSTDFVKKMGIMRDKNDEMPANFATELGAWALESIGVIALEQRLGAMAFDREPETEQLIKVEMHTILLLIIYYHIFKYRLLKISCGWDLNWKLSLPCGDISQLKIFVS